MMAMRRCPVGVSSHTSPSARKSGARGLRPQENGSIMSQAYVIECGELAAGIVTREQRGFVFHAAANAFRLLDGQMFRTPQDAQRAADKLGGKRAARRGAMDIRQ